ncbi:MAG: phosphoribosyltransferase [Candidatus Zixiibacteriota bacterium]|nr:MAG: phosphoribosyltransferase [candidate division Zixibacteria bacterium]
MNGGLIFRDRREAGRQLAERLKTYTILDDVLVLALPRGGVPVGYEIARTLNAPLDVFLVRKLGVPGHEELAMGSIATGGVRVLNTDIVNALRIPDWVIEEAAAREERVLEQREISYREGRPAPQIAHRTVILVDDGLATGASMRAAVRALRAQNPAALIVAVPVAAESTCRQLSEEVDAIVCLETPEPLFSVGYWYEDFSQTTDEEVRHLLQEAYDGRRTEEEASKP